MTLTLRYTPLNEIKLWSENPKKHDLELLIESIGKHGFQNPPKFDKTLDGIIAGNGRIAALLQMKERGLPLPTGIQSVDNEWYIPVVYGNDFSNTPQAIGYALDDNNITLLGGDFRDTTILWDVDRYMELIKQADGVSISDVELLMQVQADEEFAKTEGDKQYLRFGKYKIPISDEELDTLCQMVEEHQAEYGDLTDFVSHSLARF